MPVQQLAHMRSWHGASRSSSIRSRQLRHRRVCVAHFGSNRRIVASMPQATSVIVRMYSCCSTVCTCAERARLQVEGSRHDCEWLAGRMPASLAQYDARCRMHNETMTITRCTVIRCDWHNAICSLHGQRARDTDDRLLCNVECNVGTNRLVHQCRHCSGHIGIESQVPGFRHKSKE